MSTATAIAPEATAVPTPAPEAASASGSAAAPATATETQAPKRTRRPREKREYAKPTILSKSPIKGVGQIRLSDLPALFRKNAAQHLRKQSLPPWDSSIRPWFFYTESSVGTNKRTGEPNPPGLFVLFWVKDPGQGGNYTGVKQLRNTEGNMILLEFGAVDVEDGIYSAEDWAVLQWGAKKALGLPVGAHPTRKPKAKQRPVKYLNVSGVVCQVEVGKQTHGLHSVTFIDGPHAGGKTKVTPDCLGEDAEAAAMIKVPELTIKRVVKSPAYTPYNRNLLDDALDTLD